MSSKSDAISRAAERAPEYLTTREAAAHLGLSVGRLELWRARGGGPPYLHVTSRIVRYRRADLDEWMLAHERRAPAAAS